ncbi:hypothetical protein PFISCL1PPCAC_17106 [Pristionchus fissidentatus]|uniref:Uncharacterized protein n=1 Tax=Pristionchus fissidentatus TaxID=1538716 RepID=A0AAV5W7H1_9BILA|nr:hypothetical protein PFISCL1PPCAC_17106 [Pristionchus fissidentatus]
MRNDVCCCGFVPVSIGSRLLSLLTMIGGALVIYNSTCRSHGSTTYRCIGIVVGVVLCVAGATAVAAVKMRKPRAMFPVIGVQSIAALFSLLYIAAFIFACVTDDSNVAGGLRAECEKSPDLRRQLEDAGLSIEKFVTSVEVVICIILFILFFVMFWFFTIHYSTYKFLKDFESKGFGPAAVDSYGV